MKVTTKYYCKKDTWPFVWPNLSCSLCERCDHKRELLLPNLDFRRMFPNRFSKCQFCICCSQLGQRVLIWKWWKSLIFKTLFAVLNGILFIVDQVALNLQEIGIHPLISIDHVADLGEIFLGVGHLASIPLKVVALISIDDYLY